MNRRACSLALAALLGWLPTGNALRVEDAFSGLAELSVPLDQPSKSLDAARRAIKDVLAGIRPEPKTAVHRKVAKTGEFVLWGDLFKTGDCFALVEVPAADAGTDDPGVAFAEWREGAWVLRQAWKIGTVWRPPSWKTGGNDYLPTTPATEPFVLEDLSGDGMPEVVFAGEVAKYFQENYLLRFSPKTRELRLVATAMAKPEIVENYVRLYFDSGRRSIWSEWAYGQWRGDELEIVASWHVETGYNENDPTFCEGMGRGTDGKPVTIRVLQGHGQEIEDAYQLTRDGRSFGRMTVKWKDDENPPPDAGNIEAAWLFEKTTGLPRRFYPAEEDSKPVLRLEDFATVTVEGDAEAAEFFRMMR